MAIENLPVWPIPPDWADPVTETLEWLTNVMASPTGAEQRQKLRISPRRYFEFSVRGFDLYHDAFVQLMDLPAGTNYWLPAWHEVGNVVNPVAPGTLGLVVRGEKVDLSGAQVLCVPGLTPFTAQLAQVASATVGGGYTTFTLTDGFTSPVAAGSKIFRAIKCRMEGSASSFTPYWGRGLTCGVKFTSLEANDWPGSPSLPSFGSFPVLEGFQFNAGEDISGTYNRLTVDLDNQTGIPARLDTAGYAFPSLSGSNWYKGRTKADTMRSVLYSLCGRLNGAWLPSGFADFVLTAPAAVGDSTLNVERNGFVEAGGITIPRQEIRIGMQDGSFSYAVISGAANGDDGVSMTINLSAPLSVAIDPAKVAIISFLWFGRMDQDSFDLTHHTDTDGVVELTFVFKRVPNLRSGADWDVQPVYDGTEH